MNNIYKVIWSKAKNCYVVASEIARSHTKSASGSEKIGGVARHALLALGAACAIACGGFVNVGAVDEVEVQTTGSSTATVYTKEGTVYYVADQIRDLTTDGDVAKNRNNIAALQTTTTDQGKQIAINTTNIATNKADINALQSELGNKADATALNTKADKSYVDTEVGKVDGKLANKADKATTLVGYGITDAYTREKTDELLNTKANAADVYTRGDIDTKLADVYSKTEVDGKITNEENARNIAIQNAINGEAENRKNAIDAAIAKEVADRNQAIKTEVDKEANARDTAIANAKNDLQTKITEEKTAREALDTRLTKAEDKITANETAIDNLKTKDTENVKYDNATVKDQITLGGAGGTKITNLKDADLSDSSSDAVTGKQLNKTNKDLKTEAQTRQDMDTLLSNRADALEKNTGGITRNDAKDETYIEKNVTVDNQGSITAKGKVTANGGVDAGAGAITTTGAVNVGSLNVENASHLKGDVTMDNKLSVTGDTTLQKTDVNGALTVTGESSLKNTTVGGTLGVTGETTLSGELKAEKDATFEKDVTVRNDLTVDGKLNVGEISMKNDELKNGKKHDSATTITADEISNLAKVTEQGNTTESQFTHNEKGTFNHARDGNNADWKESNSNVTADGVSNKMTDSDGNRHTYYQTAAETKEQLVNGDKSKSNFEKKTAEGNTISITEKDAAGNPKSSLTNTQTVAGEKTSVTNKDSSSTVNQGADQIRNYVASTDGTKSSTEVKADGITNTSDGTITNDANHIENKANTMDTTVTGKATESYGELETTVNGNETHTVTGNQDIHVTGKQTNTVEGGQENIISGGQTNTITGDQTTTITGNKTETVTENVTEDYKKDLTTTVGGNETHEVKGTKTETVEGKVTENYNGGQETNVTGDQVIKVSGTQTTTATDIKRNASGGMIDTIDNDYGTNTETKVAGSTTTEVSIKGTDESGTYIRGATEARDYIIKGTLSNSETKTAEATSTEITDGTNKASTIQKVTDLAGSVTNGKETGVSGIHANKDGSVSIDSAVAGGGMSSVINQKKDSITSAVGDSTSSTVILQDKDNVTITSSNGAVGIVGKDIVNNAQATITNTAGTSITNQVNDSKVTTDANGTTFENNTPAVSDGGATTTKINGNQITTGRVDANELGVSDKDGTNTADLSVKVGEGVKASASDGTTTGSLDVTADEVGSTVKDASGKGSTFKQRIDAIMMESKNVSIKAEETLTNEAKVITNKASEVINNEAININNTATGIIKSKASEIQNQADRLISNKVGENTWENMEDGKITTSIKNGTKQNLTQSDAEKTEHSVVNGSNSTVNKQTSEEITDAVTNGTTTNVTQNTATSSNNTIADKNGNANTVISTADGTSFINSDAMTPVTGASGAGTHLNTTIKGNTITTGKVTMDYADVMKDLGVHGNANITGKTTTGSLEVTGTSTLKGDVTMGSNATVTKDLSVGGTTTTKTLKVTENAEIDGNATIKGDVTARSYKVGGKTYIDSNGINANNQKITNVADGSISEGSKDAVNGGQLYTVKNDLEGKVNKVGANAAAMANLHPMEFDPDSKWNIAAAIGNYGSETAAALGAFYRPNDDVMVNLSTAFGTGENMVGGGVSVRLGKGGNKLSREENNALKDQVADLTARMDALLSVLNPNMSKDFPDVPENHWAYEAVSRLAGNDIVQGYPDGEFHGERTMTRYEMAEIIYNALSRGAEAEKELVEEFKPELQAMAASEKTTAERAEG